MPGKVALAGRDKILNRDIKIAEANLPSWLTESGFQAAVIEFTNAALGGKVNLADLFPSVKQFGATGDGTTDDTAAIQTALNAGGCVVFPKGNYKVTSTLTVPGNATVYIATAARVFAGATIAGAIFKTSTAFVRSIQFTGGGVIDCAEIADTGIHLYYFAHVKITDIRIDSAKVHGIKLGATGAAGRSAEAVIDRVHIFRLAPNQIPVTSNWGIFVENSGDHSISQVVIQGYRVGVFMASGTSSLHDVHVWHDPATGVHDTSFEDNGNGNVYTNCYSDTPASYGFRLRGFNNRVDNCTVYLNPNYGSDNVVRGIKFEQTNPFAAVTNTFFTGGDATHRLAVDIEINGGDFTTQTYYGNLGSNVQTQNAGPRARAFTTRDLIFNDKGSLPTASSSLRGQVNTVRGAAGAADALFMCVKKADDTYAWVQLMQSNSLMLNVLDWGAKGDNATDDTAAIQACIDYAATLTSTSTVVYFPPLYYKVRTLEMKKGVTLQGSNRDMTRLYAIPGDTSPALITIDDIYVDHMWINDLGIRGAGAANPGQHGIYAYARNASEAFSTGWGNGGMNRCVVKDFQGSQLWLRGGGGTRGYWQHQFLEFNHCDFYADYTQAASKSVYITGKNGQLTWVQCQFNTSGGTSESAGTNLVIKQEVNDAGANISTGRSYALHFSNCSVEARAGGVEIEGAFNVTFDTTFMEALAFAIKTTGDHRSLLFVNTHWANAASNTALTGILVNNTASNQVLLVGGAVLGVANKAWAGPVDSRGIFTDAVLTSSNVTGQFAIAANAINIRGYKTGLVNSPGTVDTITSSLHPGEIVTLKAFGGDLSLTSAGNINLGVNASPFIVQNGSFVTLVKTDLGTTGWVLVAVSPQDPVMKSPNGTRYRLTVGDDGALTTTAL